MPFGFITIGPPGSGKTTCCHGLSLFLRAGRRDVCVVNLDPAADNLPYECNVDLCDLVSVEQVQQQLGLGPNGGLAYCFDYLDKNMDWLKEQLQPFIDSNCYFVFDCPGQAELFMCHDSFKRVVKCITSQWHINLTAVQLVDSHLCTGPHTYLSALLMCLSSMLQLELPHVNVISKADLLHKFGRDESVEQLTDISQLKHQLQADNSVFGSRYSNISAGLCDVVDDYSLTSVMTPLSIDDAESVQAVIDLIDQANGFALCGVSDGRPVDPYGTASKEQAALGSTATMWRLPDAENAFANSVSETVLES